MSINKQRGFSLIEALVGVAVLALLGLLLVDLVSRILRIGNKTQLIGTIKDNGQAAMTIMESAIRQSDTVICPINNTTTDPIYRLVNTSPTIYNNVLVVSKGGQFTRFSFINPANPQNGYIVEDNPTVADPTDPNQIITLCSPPANPSSLQKLTDTANVSLVSDTSTSTPTANGTFVNYSRNIFIKSHNPGYKDIVTIQFDLQPSVTLGNNRVENQVGTNNIVHFIDSVEIP